MVYKSRTTTNRAQKEWKKPPNGSFIINFDASKPINGCACDGFIIRDHMSNVVSWGGAQCGRISALEAEVRAMFFGIRKAIEMGLNSVCIEGGGLTVINYLTERWKPPWEVEMLIADCRILCQKLTVRSVGHVFRDSNTAADRVAHLLQSSDPDCFHQDPIMRDLIRKDVVGL